uniref:ABC-type xenobiotic transporter n=1 Tax=Phlebotomus papatasi TaxID=29031 RepID=A0A1B0DDU0_PHLPP
MPQGKTVALVGPSGCGKSTCIQLLLRFYDPDQGKVKLDGVSTVDFSIRNLRSHLGLVSQEPVLFDRTIAENIAYGDNSRVVSMEEIIEAAKEAQIHSEFITKLPLGYDTPLGSRGTQLSGGQKQRIAIARATLAGLSALLQTFAFGKAGVHLTSLLRKWSFSSAMRQEMTWYDVPENSVGALSARLSSDCANVQGATGSRLAGILQATAAVAIGFIIGLIASWKLALIVAITIPILLAVAVIESQYAKSSAIKEKTAMESASRIAVEAISNIRTVASLGQEHYILQRFNTEIDLASREAIRSSKFRGLAYSLNMTMNIFTYGLSFLAGGYLIADGSANYVQVITSVSNTTDISTVLLPIFGGGRILVNATISERREALREDAFACFIISTLLILVMVFGISIAIYIMNLIALRQTTRIRKLFLKSVLSQDMTWYDSKSSLDFATKITSNLDLLKDAIGEKLVTTVLLLSAFTCHMTLSFVTGWQLTIVIGGVYTVLIVGCSIFVGKSEARLAEREVESYSVAGSIAEEVFNSIRTVAAFGGEEKESQRYAESLRKAEKTGILKSFYSGLQSGVMWFLVFGGFGCAFYYGIHLMVLDFDLPPEDRTYTVKTILLIVLCMINGAQFVTFTIPSLETIIAAKGSSTSIYEVINRRSKIDPFSPVGKKIENFRGDVEFKNIRFEYPSRSDVKVLKGISFKVHKGQTVALVGSSGSGKSTCLQLIQRLYDPIEGIVSIDEVNIKELNIAFLRSRIGVVGQEPVLFSATIAENIRYGNPEATHEEIIAAAKIANCHNFIEKLPLEYNTMLAENSTQLSGGQKQRIAIARAIVRNPKILLLDEATSALDTESEREVQKALDKASEGRTTLIVSHRLSSIRNANEI